MEPPELIAVEQVLGDGRRFIAQASADLESAARSLLTKLAERDAQGPRMEDGSTLRFGWSRLTLRQRGPRQILFVHEPDFLRDPERDTVAHLNCTLGVLRDQTELLQSAGVEPHEVYFNQILVCERGVFEASECYFERRTATGDHDSGWLAGIASPSARPHLTESDLDTLPVYRLLEIFPEAMRLLTLPMGSLGVFRYGRLTALFRPNGSLVSHFDRP